MTTITTRSAKGAALTHSEMDANLTNLNTSKIESVSLSDLSITASIAEMNLLDMSASGSSTGDVLTSAGSGSAPAWAANAPNPYTAQSKTSNGYIKLKGGVMIQWGTYTTAGTGVVTFPVAFPSACRSVTTARNHGRVWSYGNEVYAYSKTTTSCYIQISGNDGSNQLGHSVNWMAIGY